MLQQQRPVVTQDRLYEYDPYFDTRTNTRFGRSYLGLISGVILMIVGPFLIALCLGDMDYGVYNLNKGTAFTNTLVWTPNPFWPSYGKGVWVGLLCLAVGILGVIAWFEQTHTAIKTYGVSSLLLSLFLFYLMITTISLIQYGERAKMTANYNTLATQKTYGLNSAMAGLSSFGFLTSIIIGFVSLAYVDTYSDSSVNLILNFTVKTSIYTSTFKVV